ncbi:hypothetical protein [Actinomycetospora lemnae]|uniref:Uncharacterized protein n=1 Tax=Actinomycetospora lemnae TaxID=3019891 RepID=A0ABT5SV66_9PSEU|nr:hypothetical protein [Actinomycetospora sp. DW7H6]MDD7966749.1 hypothetical protein [Actinomycetospora sp. DW7H6]
MDDDARVTTMVVGLLIAFCAVLLAKWLAVVALAALLLLVVLRLALRRVRRGVRARRAGADEPAVVALPTVAERPAAVPAPVTRVPGPTCSWCGLVGGHHDLRGRPVRPRHAHALPAPARHAS